MNNANRIINVFVITSLLFLLLTGFAAAAIPITNLEELMAINDDPTSLSQDYILMNEIDIDSEKTGTLEFIPIGTYRNPFTGTFDGQGNVISNITYTDSTLYDIGLFGATRDASISNLKLENINLTNEGSNGPTTAGALIGVAVTTSVNNCSAENITVKGPFLVGGLFGSIDKSEISESYANGTVEGIGGVGGLSGSAEEDSKILKSYAIGTVKGQNGDIGGLVGYTRDSKVSESYATATVIGGYGVGGLIGWIFNSEVSESYATGTVTGGYGTGGLVGQTASDSIISKSYATGNVEDAGSSSNGLIGGLVGFLNTSEITESYATGTTIGLNDAGGLVGSVRNSNISESYAIGDVSGLRTIGGFVGYMNNTNSGSYSISNSYAMGDVTGTDNIGGFVGYIRNDGSGSNSISNSYVTGNAEGTGTYVGGFVGQLSGLSEIIDSFYIGNPDSADDDKGFFVTPAKLKQIETFRTGGDYVSTSWDISSSPDLVSIWYINEGNGYPKFEWYEAQKSGTGGGTGTGSATIVDNNQQNSTQPPVTPTESETSQTTTGTNGSTGTGSEAETTDSTPTTNSGNSVESSDSNPPASSNPNKVPWALIAIGILIVIGCVGYYLYRKQ